MKFAVLFMRAIMWLLIFLFCSLTVVIYLLRSDQALLTQKQKISAERVSQARQSLHQIAHQLNNSTGIVEFEFSQNELDAMMAVASYAVPATHMRAYVSKQSLSFIATTKLDIPFGAQYINLHCILLPSFDNPTILQPEYCELGDIKLPNWLIVFTVERALNQVFDRQLTQNILAMVKSARLKHDSLQITLFIKEGMKQEVLAALHKQSPQNLITSGAAVSQVDAEKVKIYLSELQRLKALNATNSQADSLAFYIGNVFYLAQLRSELNDAYGENQAALWALVIAYGNKRFGHFIGLPRELLNEFSANQLTLKSRQDLKLHFLYSAALERLVRTDMGLKVGELKEILDSDSGGTGFSFADLAADKAGLAFAKFVLEHPELAQQRLSGSLQENMFFPKIKDLPESLAEEKFNQEFGDIHSAQYKEIERKIDQRVAQLSLYNGTQSVPAQQ
ncbi:hypothetical protein [Catenovulum sediminis]|uniref:Uncharacterized protein n=1 Tax=Catenovulum sediminis TaxID=1740262 RepID=A0ABV1RN33_9ALTE